jgi:predicted fused transcriptional regulator/phosphomethylpyrimidine kinase
VNTPPLARLPIAGALVWLALYASRESALAKRLEEDYGYKSAIASCFEGFRKQMSEVGKDVVSSSPLAKLCGDTLTTVAAPPGRIYDKHNLTVTPASEFTEAAKAAVDVVNAAKLGTK